MWVGVARREEGGRGCGSSFSMLCTDLPYWKGGGLAFLLLSLRCLPAAGAFRAVVGDSSPEGYSPGSWVQALHAAVLLLGRTEHRVQYYRTADSSFGRAVLRHFHLSVGVHSTQYCYCILSINISSINILAYKVHVTCTKLSELRYSTFIGGIGNRGGTCK